MPSADLVEAVFSNISEGVAITDSAGCLTASNKEFWKLARFFPQVSPTTINLNLEKVLARESIIASGLQITKYGDGKHLQLHNLNQQSLEIRSNLLPDGRKIWFFYDATERRQIDERLNQFQRLESLGQLTGQVAHDFNNVLSAITLTVPLLKAKRQNSVAHSAALDRLHEATEMGVSLTHRLLAFAKKQQLDPEIVEINDLVTGVKELIAMSLGDSVTLLVECHSEPLLAKVDPGQLESALLNLCLNSGHAIPETGTVTVSIRSEADKYGVIEVSDDGCGMPPDVLERALEPFFSTRGSGQGSGLGLSMAYGFTRQTGGEFLIESTPGAGTRIQMKLPLFGAEHRSYSNELNSNLIVVDENASERRSAPINCSAQAKGIGGVRQMPANTELRSALTDINMKYGRSAWNFAIRREPQSGTSGALASPARNITNAGQIRTRNGNHSTRSIPGD